MKKVTAVLLWLVLTSQAFGQLTVKIDGAGTVVVDLEKKTVTFGFEDGRVTLELSGLVPSPSPPDPPVDPIDARPSASLRKAIQDAYTAETDTKKRGRAAALAVRLATVVKELKASGEVTTSTDFDAGVRRLVEASIGKMSDGSLPVLRPVIGHFVSSRLTQTPGVALDDAYWRSASVAYSQVAQALREVK